MAVTNFLQDVVTYNDSNLAFLQNSFAFISTANKKFKDFDKITGQLGDTVSFDLPPRYIANSGLVATFQASTQRKQELTVDKSANVSSSFSAQERIFNVADYMDKFGKAAMMELGTEIESNVAQNTVIDHTFRFFGDGETAINSFGQLAQALAFFRNFGAAKTDTKAIIPDIDVAAIVNTGLNQFAPLRNDEIATSWKLGNFSRCDWMDSNLLPTHVAGVIGDDATPANRVLTVVSTDDPTGANITQITFNSPVLGATGALKKGDLLEFNDGVAGQPNLRYLTFIGHKVSANKVQVRVTENANTDGSGNVTVSISPALRSTAGANQNLNNNIVAGMKATAMPSHRAGIIMAGNPLFLGMPMLPDESPFTTANTVDPDSGCSIRMYSGSKFGENERGTVHDAIWGSTMVDEYAMRVLFPL